MRPEGKGGKLTGLARRALAESNANSMTSAMAVALSDAQNLTTIGVETAKYSAGPIEITQATVPPLRIFEQNAEDKAHIAWLDGSVMLESDGMGELITGPKIVRLPVDKPYKITALTKVMWLCISHDDQKVATS
jgi:hypothetical protein